MDYRSREAIHIGDMFINAQMRNVRENVNGTQVTVGFENRQTGSQYLRTTQNRLVRLDTTDTDEVEYNLLSRDCKRFEPWEPGWRRGEELELRRPFTRGDLIPPQTMGQWLWHDVGTRLVQFAAIGILGRGAIDAATYVGHHIAHAAVAGSVAGAGAAGYAMHDHITNQAAGTGNDADPIHYNDIPDLHASAPHVEIGHAVPGSTEHHVDAPNGCELDGTTESAGAAMLPGACKTKVTWLAFDYEVDDTPVGAGDMAKDGPYGPQNIGYLGYGDPSGTTINAGPMGTAEKIVLGATVGVIGTGLGVMARDMCQDDYRRLQRDVNRRLDAAQPAHSRRGFGMPPPQR